MKMPPQPSTDQTLSAENALLRARLEVAEETLRAIRAGELSALVVAGDAGPQLFTLQGLDAEQSRVRGEMLAQVADTVIAVDAEMRVTYLNAAAERMYGVRAGDMLGRNRAEIFTPHWPSPEAEAGMWTALSERGQWRGELIHRTPDGRELDVEVNLRALRGPDGAGTGFVTVIRDIRERQQVEAALRLTNERLTLAVKCSQVVLFQQDLELRYQWIQNAAPGFEGSDVIGKRDADLMERAADAAVTEALKREVITSGVSMRQEVLAQVEGAVRQYDLLVEPLRDAAGLISGITGAAIDITERKHAEAALRETERNYRALADASLEIPYRMSADWSTMLPLDGREVFASSDLPLADWRWVDQYLPRDEHARVRQTISDAIGGKTLFEMEHRFLRLDGSTGWVRSRAVPIFDENEEVIAWFGAASDITTRKQAEERLRLAIAGSDLGTWHWDLRTGGLDWSERCLTIFGLPPRTAMSYEKFIGALHPEDRARADDAVRRALQDGSDFRIEFRSVWPDGSVHWAVSQGRAYYDAAGEPTRMEGIALDITERQRAEEARLEMERNYRALASASSEVAYRMSADWSTMLPLDGGQLIASSDQPLADWAWLDQNLPRDEHARVRQAIEDAIARKTFFELEHRVRRADGSMGWTFSRAVPILDENEAVIAWFGAASDITARKQAEEERQLLASIVENSRDFIGIADTHGNPVYGNRAALELMGVKDMEQVRRSKIIDYFIPEQRQFVEEVVLPAVATAGRWTGELTMQHFVTGAKIPVWYDLFRVDDRVTGQPVNFATISRDLTESKRVEQALADRTELLNGVMEGTTDVIFVKDLNGRVLLANAACAAVLRSTPEQVVGKTTEELMLPDLAAAVRQHDEAVIAGGSPVQLEETLLVAGEARVFLTLKAPLRDAGSHVVGILGISRDITERRAAEEELRYRERLHRIAFDQAPTAMVFAALDGRYIQVNARMCELTGYSAEELVRMKGFDLTHPEDRERDASLVESFLSGGTPRYENEKRYVCKGGIIRWVAVSARMVSDSAGQPLHTMGVMRDITDRKRAEAALAERTEILNGVLEGATDVIFVKDLNSRMVLVNAAFAAAARSTPEQIVGKTDEDWFPPHVAAAVRQQDEAVIAGGLPMQFEETIPVAGEARVFLTLKAPLRDASNRIVGVVGIGRDITERKLIELNLISAIAVAEKASRAKSDFLSNMSHELRTPLNAILGFAQLLESGTPAPTPAQKRNLDQILKGGWYLLDLINELLDLAQIESGNLSVTQEPVSLAEVMQECQAMFEPQARKRGIGMTFPSFEVAGYVGADRTRVKQVVINLLSNAIKYNKAEGAVAVEWTLSLPDAIRISVRDTGEGLSAEKLAQLFQPFNWLGQEAGPQVGTGIGLVMTKRLVELMGGSIGADSVVGVGSVFWFELKRASAPQSALLPAEASGAGAA